MVETKNFATARHGRQGQPSALQARCMRERMAVYQAWVDARMMDSACATALLAEDARGLGCDCSALLQEFRH